jgi:hypothetical protein
MANRGVWSLENVEIKYPQGDWVNVDDVFLIPAVTRVDTCYWAGGAHSGNSQAANCDKTSIGSNTTSQIPALNSVLAGMWRGGFSSATVGYAAGSHPGPSTGQMSKIDKVTYATDTGETNMAHLSSGRGYLPVGPNNNTHGYTLGGGESGSPWAVTVSKVDRFTFAAESAELLPSTQLLGSRMNGCTSSNTEKGYVCGGNGGPIATTIEKIEYSTDTITSIPARLPLPMRRGGGSVNDDGSIGYYIGGNTSPGMTYLSSCTKHVYATDTISDVTSGRLYTPRGNLQGAGNGTYALTAGGYYYTPSGGGQHYSSVDRMSYSNESSSRQPGLNMSQNRKRGAGFGARTYARGTTYDGAKIRWKDNADQSFNWGIFVGGNGPGGGSNVDKINYVTDTIGKSSNIGGSENIRNTAAGSSATKGYFMCGRMPAWPWSQGQSFVWKYTYSTDSVTYTGGSPYLLPNRGYGGIAIDSPTSTTTFWMQGPWNPSQTSMRVTHSTGNVSNVPSLYNGDSMPAGQMTMYDAAAVSNLATPVAYVHGGTNPNQSRTEKYDFSTDNRISLPGANTAQYLSRHSAASSGTDGYFSSGYSPGQGYQSYMNKFTYSTETMALLPGTVQQSSGNPSWAGQEYGGSTGNKEQGYWYGGMAYSGSNITKIVYSTDTPSSLPGRMTSAQPSPVYNRGIQAGSTGVRASNRPGMIGPFPDATPTATKSPMPFPTSDKIYFSGGLTSSSGTNGYPPTAPAASTISNTDKLTMASETVAAAPGANLVTGKYFATAFSSSTAAYVAGGFNAGGPQPNPTSAPGAVGGAIQTCDKITYANDTMSRMPNTDHCSGSMWQGAGNNIKGYFAGSGNAGSGGSYGSRTDKLTFATDVIEGLNTPGFGRGHGGVGVYEGPGASGGGGIYFTQGEYAYPWHPSPSLNQNSTRVMRTSTETGMDVPGLTFNPYSYLQSWSNPTHWMVYGGWTSPSYPSPNIKSTAMKTTWSTETKSELPSSTGENLSGAGSGGSNTYGYAGGGRTTSSGDMRSYVLRYTFESDTFAFRPSSNLTGDKRFVSGTSAKEHTNPDPYYISTPNVI